MVQEIEIIDNNRSRIQFSMLIVSVFYFISFAVFIFLFLATSTGNPFWFIQYNYSMVKISLILAISLFLRSNNIRLLSIFILFVQLFWGICFWVFGMSQFILKYFNSKVIISQAELLSSVLGIILFLWLLATIRITIIKFLLKPETKEWFCLEERILRWIKDKHS